MKRPVARIALTSLRAGRQPGAVQQRPTLELAGRSPGLPSAASLTYVVWMRFGLRQTIPTLLLYGSGRTILANHARQCGLRSDDVLVTSRSALYYCRGDLVRSFDRYSRIPGPACVLGDFVPYSR